MYYITITTSRVGLISLLKVIYMHNSIGNTLVSQEIIHRGVESISNSSIWKYDFYFSMK